MNRKNKCSIFLEKIPRFLTLVFSGYIVCTILLNIIVDNKINKYYKPNSLDTPSYIWFGCSVLLFLLALLSICKCISAKEDNINKKSFYKIIFGIFAIVYLIQVFISNNIYFKTGWDAGTLRNNAENIALFGERGVEFGYFSYYPNNTFTVYLLVL